MSFRHLTLACLVVGLVSCATDSYQRVPRPNLGVEISNPEVVRIYVFRDDQLRGSIRNVRVYEARQEIGSIAPGDFLCWERRPGRSLLRIVFERPAIDGGEIEGILDLQVAPGEVAYCRVHLGERGKPQTETLDARAGVELIEARSPAPVN